MTEPVTALSEALYQALQKEAFVLLHTIDAGSGRPTANAISWLYAADPGRIRFAVDARSRMVANILEHPDVTMTVPAAGSVFAVYGKAKLITDQLEEVPFKLACFESEIDEIRDAMFYGARLSVAPEVEKTYDKRAADKLDRQVFAAMKKA